MQEWLGERLHQNCFACSDDNPFGLKLKFEDAGLDRVCACFSVGNQFSGYNKYVHGGIISTILDSAMTHLLMRQGIAAMTAQLNIRFKNPMSLMKDSIVTAHLIKSKKPLYELKASILQDEQLIAKADARFMIPLGVMLEPEDVVLSAKT